MMTKAERRRLDAALAEVERLQREHERQGEVIRNLIHAKVRLDIAIRDALDALDEVRE